MREGLLPPYALALIAAAIGGLYWFLRRLEDPTGPASRRIRLSDIPLVERTLRTKGQEESFAAFSLLHEDGSMTEDSPTVQFSIEKGRFGLDWVLTSERNCTDETRFRDLAESLGYDVTPREMNGVHYLRVEKGDLLRLCNVVFQDLYGARPSAGIDLHFDGLDGDEFGDPAG